MHHCIPTLWSSSLSSCHSLWSPGKLLSSARPSTPLLHSISACHYHKWETGLKFLPVSPSCWSPGANCNSSHSPDAGQLGRKTKDRQAEQHKQFPVWYIILILKSVFCLLSRILSACSTSLKPTKILTVRVGHFSGSKPSQECQATCTPALIWWHVCIYLEKIRLGNSILQLITHRCRTALNNGSVLPKSDCFSSSVVPTHYVQLHETLQI